MKTAYEWFETIKDEHLAAAAAGYKEMHDSKYDNASPINTFSSLSEAIGGSFDWASTNTPDDWSKLYYRAQEAERNENRKRLV